MLSEERSEREVGMFRLRTVQIILIVFLVGCAAVCLAQGEEPAAAPTSAAAPAPSQGAVSLMQVIKWGGPIGYVIILLSVVTLMLIVRHLFSLRRKALCPDTVRDKLAECISERKFNEALEFVQKDNSMLSRVLSIGFSRLSGGYSEMEQVMNDAAEDEAMRLEQGVGNFALIANVAPLLGLLGTVVGMVFAFDKIANDPAGAATPSKLAEPIEMALVTTVFGLLVGIPNVLAHTAFRNKLHRLLAEVGLAVDELMLPLRGMKRTPVVAASGLEQPAQEASDKGATKDARTDEGEDADAAEREE